MLCSSPSISFCFKWRGERIGKWWKEKREKNVNFYCLAWVKRERKENKMGEVFGWKMVKGKERKKNVNFYCSVWVKRERKENKMGEVFGWKMVKGKERKKNVNFYCLVWVKMDRKENKMGDVFTHLFLPNWRGKKMVLRKKIQNSRNFFIFLLLIIRR